MKDAIRENYLLYRVQSRKDPQAYAELYDRYVTPIYRFVYFKVSSHEDAEDITADTFLKAWHYLTEHSGIRSFRAVIYRIARNLVIDLYRKRAVRERDVAMDGLDEHGAQKLLSDEKAFVKQLETKQDHQQVLEAIGRLKEEYREVLLFRYIDGLSTAEVAEIIGSTKTNVRVTSHRAMNALKKLIAEHHQHDTTGA